MQYHVIMLDARQHASFLEQGRRDPVTKEEFKVGDRVVMCAACRSAFLEGSWRAIGRSHCGQERTLKNLAVDTTRKRFSRADASAVTPPAVGTSPTAAAPRAASAATTAAPATTKTTMPPVPPRWTPPATAPPASPPPTVSPTPPAVPPPAAVTPPASAPAAGPLRLARVPVRLVDVPIRLRPVVPLKRIYR